MSTEPRIRSLSKTASSTDALWSFTFRAVAAAIVVVIIIVIIGIVFCGTTCRAVPGIRVCKPELGKAPR